MAWLDRGTTVELATTNLTGHLASVFGAMILQFQFYGVQMVGRLQDFRRHDLDGIRTPRFCPGL